MLLIFQLLLVEGAWNLWEPFLRIAFIRKGRSRIARPWQVLILSILRKEGLGIFHWDFYRRDFLKRKEGPIIRPG